MKGKVTQHQVGGLDENGEGAKKDEKKEKKKCKDYFWVDPKDRFLSTFDTFMLLIVAYSCFSSAYFTAFDFPANNELVYQLENVVFSFFLLDIIFNFMRVPDNDGDEKIRDHSTVAKRYLRSG